MSIYPFEDEQINEQLRDINHFRNQLIPNLPGHKATIEVSIDELARLQYLAKIGKLLLPLYTAIRQPELRILGPKLQLELYKDSLEAIQRFLKS